MTMSHAEADRRIENVLQLGPVIEVDEGAGKARVRLGDLVSPFIPWLAQKSASNHSWWPLEKGEWVLVAVPSGDMAQAVIVGTVPAGKHPPYGAAGTWRHTFADGSFIQFADGNITIKATGDVSITAGGNVSINGARVDLN